MDKAPQVTLRSTSHYFLEGLNEIGLDYLFCNLGTDHAPLIEEMARWRREGMSFPKTVLCPHENVACHMAAGYAIATGRGQGVMVHVDAGTANSSMAMHNMYRARLPVMLIAGRAPYTSRGELPGSRDSYVHFVQEPFDQASVVRPYMKWEYTLPTGVITKEALRRAHTVMQSDPKGPVYLMLPRETLTQTWDSSAVRAYPADRYGAVEARGADAETVATIVDKLLAAKSPTLITAYAGRNPKTAPILDELARFAGIRVFEFNPVYLNIPHDSPCFAGSMPGKHVADSDVGLMVDVDVPWIPKDTADSPAHWWAHIDIDTVKRAFPMWNFPSNLRVEGDSCRILAQILASLKAKAGPAFREAAAQRVEALGREHAARSQSLAKLAADKGKPGEINPNYVCAEIGRAIGADDVVVNEAVRNQPAVFNQVMRTRPGSVVGLAGGGLGFSGGMALGIKLANPDKTVVQIIGDGVFYFSTPEAVYSTSKQYGLPIFTVVLDNSGWAAVKEATLRVYPDGIARDDKQFEAHLATGMDFGKVVESAGGYGEKVENPDEVPAAIARCLKEVRGGRSAVLHVKIVPL